MRENEITRAKKSSEAVKATAMMRMASRSSTTASVSKNARRAVGRAEPITARTASANAMSVAAGIAQPRRSPPVIRSLTST